MDSLLRTILIFVFSLFFPHGLAGFLAREFLGRVKGVIILILILIMFLSTITLAALFNPQVANSEGDIGLPEELKDFVAKDFNDTNPLNKSPFGGEQLTNSKVTAYFKDPNYFKVFNRWHLGVDLIPSENYYANDQGYALFKDVLIYATCSGVASSLRDSAGANYIYLECGNHKYAALFVHNKYNFLTIGTKAWVETGRPIGVMGSTGNSTGAHVHYAIKDLTTNAYLDPLEFILRK